MTEKGIIPRPKTKFYRLKCPGCGNEQNVFSAASTRVTCVVCNAELAKTKASKIETKTKILKIFN